MARKPNATMGRLIDEFLADKRANNKPATYTLYATYLNSFRASHGELDANALTSTVLRAWIDKRYARGSSSSKRFAARAVLAVLHRAYVDHVIDRKPIRGFTKARDGRRTLILTPAQYAACVRVATGPFRDAVKFLYHTGVRPQEFRLIESGWCHGRRKIVLPEDVAKTGLRNIYLDNFAANMIERLCGQHSGVIFRNKLGRPWTAHNLTYQFRLLRLATGIPLVPYTFRHTWITRLLERGVDRTTVAELARTSVRMIDDVYGHVDQNESRLLSMLD